MGDGAVRRRGGRVARARLRGPARRRGRHAVSAEAARPGRGRGHRRRRDRHQRRLPPDPGSAGPTCSCSSRAGSPCGTTWHAAGLVGQLRASESGTRLVQYSTELYARLEDETGLVDRLPAVRRGHRRPDPGPDDPAAADGGDRGGVRPRVRAAHAGAGARALPGDARRRPGRRDLAARRRQGQPDRPHPGAGQGRAACGAPGSSSRSGSPASTSSAAARRASGSAPTRGTSRPRSSSTAPASGPRQVGDLAGVTVPLHSAEHFYVVTEPFAGRPPRPADPARPGRLHLLQGGGRRPGRRRLRAGGQAVGVAAGDPYPFEFQLLEEDWEHFSVLMDSALLRIPALRARPGIRKFYNGPESFTPDNQFLLGEAPERARLLRRRGLQLGRHRVRRRRGPGARGVDRRGRAGAPTSPASTSAGSRRSTATSRGCAPGSAEVLGLHYAVPWPNRELDDRRARSAARPCTTVLEAASASFGSRMGWERPNFFAPAGEAPAIEYAWGKPTWLPWSAAEQRQHAAPAVAVFDQTSFSKYLVAGPGALAGAPVGVHRRRRRAGRRAPSTPRCSTRRGTYESDLTVTRTGARGVPAGQQRRDHGARPGPPAPAPA